MSVTLDLHPEFHNEFHFSPDTESSGNCCCWKSKPAKKKEYVVNERHELEAVSKSDIQQRIQANQRLAAILQRKFDQDPIDNNEAFERLKLRINDSFSDNPITSQRLSLIIEAVHNIRQEVQREDGLRKSGSGL